MSDLLVRDSYDGEPVELRRLVVIVAIVIVLSGGWHGLRGMFIHGFATTSAGCPGREDLIRAGLLRSGFDISKTDSLRGHSLPRPGWVAWSSALEVETLPDRSQRVKRWRTTVVDGCFRLLGTVPTGFHDLPMDIDGDGRWEVRVGETASETTTQRPLTYHAVLRMGLAESEIIWLGLFDDSSWRARGIRVFPKWLDDDGDGVHELAFITVVVARNPSGGVVFKPPETVASFKLDRPGGLLRSHNLREDCGIVSWSPPDEVPFRLDQAAELEPLFRELLPVPEQPDE